MSACDYTKLRLYFNEFHSTEGKEMPEYGEFCFLRLKDGRCTAGAWVPDEYGEKKTESGKFGRGQADMIDVGEASDWHPLDRYDLMGVSEG